MRTSNYKSYLLSFASASAIAFAASPVVAQDAADDEVVELEEIVVTGIRASIMSSIARKRESSSIVEAITAEDIGKLPDASIGESLARLPGLAAQRFDGRANKIAIRGLAPDFTRTTLNGRELVSSDNNRAVEYDQFPSELITGATIYKTPDASLQAQAVGGTVDMQTVRPLSYDEPVLAMGFRGEVSDKGALNAGTSAWGYRGNFAYIGQNDDGTVGYAIGYARMVQPIQEQYIHVWGYSDRTDGDGNVGQVVDGAKPYVKSNELTRDGILGVLELAPSDSFRARLDVMYSKFADEQTLRGQEIAGYTATGGTINAIGGDGLVTDGTFHDLLTMPRNDFSDRDAETFAAGFNMEWDRDEWNYEADLSYSKATRTYSAYEVYSAIERGSTDAGRADYNYTLGGENGLTFNTPVDFADSSLWGLGDNLGWGGPLCTEALGWQCASQDGFRNSESSSDELAAIKLAAERQMDNEFLSSVKFGVAYTMRDKENARRGDFLTLNDYPDVVPVPSSYLLDPTSLDFIGIGDMLSFDSRGLVADGFYYFSPENELAAARNDYIVEEDVFTAYAMANIDTMAGDMPVTGNVGLQAVYTDQSSTGSYGYSFLWGESGIAPVSEGVDYWEWLPSLNLSFGVAEDHKLRVGVARVMARARMDQMRAGREPTFDDAGAANNGTFWRGNGGNPSLKPWMAWQFDLSYEMYFGQGGYVSVAGFYKKLQNYVFTDQIEYDATDFSVPSVLIGTAYPADFVALYDTDTGFLDAPVNGEGGKIYGIELSASIPFGMFSESLEGFGFLGSASFTDSSVKETADSEATELPGLSKNVINGTLYYENMGFQARVSARYRSSFLAEAYAIGLSREETIARGETVIDAQLSYDLDEVGFEGVTVYLQGSNLTNEPFVQYLDGNPDKFKNWHTYGRNFMFGFSFKM